MALPVIAIAGRIVAALATSPAARKVIADGAAKFYSENLAQFGDDKPYGIGRLLGQKANQVGKFVSSKADAFSNSEGVKRLLAAQAPVKDSASISPRQQIVDKALLATAHRVNVEAFGKDPAASDLAKSSAEVGLQSALRDLTATMAHLKPQISEENWATFKGLKATLEAPTEIDALQTIKDRGWVARATVVAQAIRQGAVAGYVSVQPGTNSIAANDSESDALATRERMGMAG